MTKNRARKHAIRATKNATGTNYTTALRATDAPVYIDPDSTRLMDPPAQAIYGQPGSGQAILHKVSRWQHNLPLGWDAEDQQVTLPVGNNLPPITFLTGPVGGGKTVTSVRLAVEFLDRHEHGRILWIDPMMSEPGYFYRRLDPARTTYLPNTMDGNGLHGTGTHFTDPLADLLNNPHEGPTLLIVEDIDHWLDNPYGETKPWQPRMVELLNEVAHTGRSRAIHAIYSSTRPLSATWAGESIANAVSNTVWVGPVRDPSAWKATFSHTWDDTELRAAAHAIERRGWNKNYNTYAVLDTGHGAPRILLLPKPL